MSSSITVTLSDEMRSCLEEAAATEGATASEIVDRALKRYLFVRRFRQLRAETLQHMRDMGQGELADEDVLAMDDLQHRRFVVERVRAGLERADTAGATGQDAAEARLANPITAQGPDESQ